VTGDPNDIEALAATEHESWARWMRHMISELRDEMVSGALGDEELDLGRFDALPCIQRWTRQMTTSYADLPEEERESDREVAKWKLPVYRPVGGHARDGAGEVPRQPIYAGYGAASSLGEPGPFVHGGYGDESSQGDPGPPPRPLEHGGDGGVGRGGPPYTHVPSSVYASPLPGPVIPPGHYKLTDEEISGLRRLLKERAALCDGCGERTDIPGVLHMCGGRGGGEGNPGLVQPEFQGEEA